MTMNPADREALLRQKVRTKLKAHRVAAAVRGRRSPWDDPAMCKAFEDLAVRRGLGLPPDRPAAS